MKSTGAGFTGALFLLFVGLKLTGHIGWSWWWVTAPLWGPPVSILAMLCVIGFGVIVVKVFK